MEKRRCFHFLLVPRSGFDASVRSGHKRSLVVTTINQYKHQTQRSECPRDNTPTTEFFVTHFYGGLTMPDWAPLGINALVMFLGDPDNSKSGTRIHENRRA